MPNKNNITIFNGKKETSDVYIVRAGKQLKTDHSFGPVKGEHHIVQYIVSGKGKLTCNGKEYPLSKYDLFLLPKGIEVSYYSDKDDPYEYYWIVFDGNYADILLKSCGLNKHNPIINIDNTKIRRAFSESFNIISLNSEYSNVQLIANLYTIFAQILKLLPEQKDDLANPTLENSIVYMEANYNKDIKIEKMCDELYINRNYFSQIFKKKYNVSPKQYLTNIRMAEAVKLLETTDLLVYAVADKIGMTTLSFIKLFKERYGCTPSEYREKKKINLAEDIIYNLED